MVKVAVISPDSFGTTLFLGKSTVVQLHELVTDVIRAATCPMFLNLKCPTTVLSAGEGLNCRSSPSHKSCWPCTETGKTARNDATKHEPNQIFTLGNNVGVKRKFLVEQASMPYLHD